MKKTLTTLAAFCFGIFISFSIIACADDFGNNDQVDKDEELQTLREMVAKLSEKVEALQSRVTVIEDDVWIGRNVIMTPGRLIKKGSIIAAGCVLSKDFPEYSIVGGNPSKLIRIRK